MTLFNQQILFNRRTVFNQQFHHHHHLGRFLTVRRTYSLVQKHWQAWSAHVPDYTLNDQSLFPAIDITSCVHQVRQQGVYLGLQLPDAIVNQIEHYARQHSCTEPGFPGEFYIDQIETGKFYQGRQVLRGLVNNLDQCQAIDRVLYDPTLMQIVRAYLGYFPKTITRHLTWSCPTTLSESEQKQLYPPANYHYDIAGLNFMAINFYITPVNSESGPHVMLLNSHQKKSLAMVLASARQTDTAVWNYYGKENELVITGDRGFGFIQDSSCYHKLIPPVSQKRLLMQIRYA